MTRTARPGTDRVGLIPPGEMFDRPLPACSSSTPICLLSSGSSGRGHGCWRGSRRTSTSGCGNCSWNGSTASAVATPGRRDKWT